jgi:hypothetical protein
MQSKMVNPIQWEKRGSGPGHGLISVMQFKDKLIAQTVYHLWESNNDFSHWNRLSPLPSGLSTYHSQLVLVGGQLNGCPTNKVWVSDDGYSWNTSLPSMPTAREFPIVVNTGTPEYLLVAGGYPCDQELEVVDSAFFTMQIFALLLQF